MANRKPPELLGGYRAAQRDLVEMCNTLKSQRDAAIAENERLRAILEHNGIDAQPGVAGDGKRCRA